VDVSTSVRLAAVLEAVRGVPGGWDSALGAAVDAAVVAAVPGRVGGARISSLVDRGFWSGRDEVVGGLVAAVRLLLPEANIPATTAMETLMPGARETILCSGANVVMPNLTEGEARRLYALYPGKAEVADAPEKYRADMEKRIRALGRFVGTGWGSRRRGAAAF